MTEFAHVRPEPSPRGATNRTEIDPITFAVVRNGLVSAATEMYTVFKRTAMLPLLYEFNDFAMSLFDEHLNVLADAPGLPILCGSLETCLHATLAEMGGAEALAPGDILFNNHPYMTAGQTADASVMAPIFVDGDIVGFAAIRGHMGDVGAMNLYPSDSRDIYQEGTILPGVKLYDRGKLNTTVTRVIAANSRLPAETVGSILAAAGAARACHHKVEELIEKYGLDVYRSVVTELLDRGEAATRSVIEGIPDGVYPFAETMDGNGLDKNPVMIAGSVTVQGSNIVVDVSESAGQQEGSINCPWGYTLAACRFAVKRLTSPELPLNGGGYRPLSVVAPEGVFNPRPPAPVFCGIWTALRLGDLVVHALAPALPATVPAQNGGDLVVALAYIRDPATARVSFFLDLGGIGLGAVHDADGTHGVMHPCQAGSESIPAEILETRMPVVKRRCELVTDSGGPGKYRGGVSTVAEFEFLGEGASTIVCEKSEAAEVQGLSGGMSPPFKNEIVIFPGTARERRLGKEANIPIQAGDTLVVRAAGGGGYGRPHERSVGEVAADVRDGYVSAQAASEVYGVIFGADGNAIDEDATAERRAAIAGGDKGRPSAEVAAP
jgi:N-methylhydantoinase B